MCTMFNSFDELSHHQHYHHRASEDLVRTLLSITIINAYYFINTVKHLLNIKTTPARGKEKRERVIE